MNKAVSRTELRDEFRLCARLMLFSAEVVDEFLERAPLSCIREVNDMLIREQEVRSRRKRERSVAKSAVPAAQINR